MQKVNLVGYLCNGIEKFKTTRYEFKINKKEFTKEMKQLKENLLK